VFSWLYRDTETTLIICWKVLIESQNIQVIDIRTIKGLTKKKMKGRQSCNETMRTSTSKDGRGKIDWFRRKMKSPPSSIGEKADKRRGNYEQSAMSSLYIQDRSAIYLEEDIALSLEQIRSRSAA